MPCKGSGDPLKCHVYLWKILVAGNETLNEAIPFNCFTEKMNKIPRQLKPNQTKKTAFGVFLLKKKFACVQPVLMG